MPKPLSERISAAIDSGTPINKYTLQRWAGAAKKLERKQVKLTEENGFQAQELAMHRKLLAMYVKECGGSAEAKVPDDWGKDVVLLTLQRRRAAQELLRRIHVSEDGAYVVLNTDDRGDIGYAYSDPAAGWRDMERARKFREELTVAQGDSVPA